MTEGKPGARPDTRLEPGPERVPLSIEAEARLADLRRRRRQAIERAAIPYDVEGDAFLSGLLVGLGYDPSRYAGVDLRSDPAVLLLHPEPATDP